MDATEATRRKSHRDAIAEHFKAHEHLWIDSSMLMELGGALAWRTRVSDCRTELGMFIENRQERIELADSSIVVQSSYRYRPHPPIGPAAHLYRDVSLFEGDPSGERR